MDGITTARTAAEHTSYVTAFAPSKPTWKVEILNSTASVDVDGGTRTTWLTVAVGGMPHPGYKDIRRESIVNMKWQRVKDGKWMLSEQIIMRGPGETVR